MRKKKILISIVTAVLAVSCFFFETEAQTGPQLNVKLTTDRSVILVKMENLLMVNQYWMQQDGWYHETKQSLPGGPAGHHFSNQDHWFEMRDGKLVNDLLLITTDQNEIVQRWIVREGMRAELEGLEKSGGEALEYMMPTMDSETGLNQFPQIAADLSEIRLRLPFIDSILMTETTEDDGQSVVNVRVEHSHHGEPLLNQHGLPPGRAVGMVSLFTYDAVTGNRIAYSMEYLKNDLTLDEAHRSAEETVFVGGLSAEIALEWDDAVEKLQYYVDLYGIAE